MASYNATRTALSQLTESIATFEIQVFLRPLLKFAQILLSFLSLLTNDYQYYPQPAIVTSGQVFDYVIIGAGTAGCVVANRLTEDPKTTVLLIDAGGVPSLASDYLGLFPTLDRSKEEWNFYSTNDGYSSQAFKNKVVHMTAGKLLGGSSGLSYNLYVRGAKEDYDKWAELGNEGWDWQSVFKYFKKSEKLDEVSLIKSDTASLHGMDGPTHIRRPEWPIRIRNYLQGFEQAGYETLFDINGYKQIGYGMSQFNSNGMNRQSTAITYLRPIRNRTNLYLLLDTLATKIIINDNKTATGVEMLLPMNVKINVKANMEVILSAGAFNSPKILMLSGVGSASHLKENNIDVVLDSPHVGENLMDHNLLLLSITGAVGFLKSFGRNLDLLANVNIFSNPLFIGHGAINKRQRVPDYQTGVLPVPAGSLITPIFFNSIYEYEDVISISYVKAGLQRETLLIAHSLLHPKSRGYVKLASNDPKKPPVIFTGFYNDPADLELHARCLEDFVNVTTTEYFKSFNAEVVNSNIKQCEDLDFLSHEYLKCYLLNAAGPMFNFGGTCAMGPKGKGVVDARLRVRGIDNLRVVDASVMPDLISGNNFAAILMIGEKASDMIKEDHKK